MLELSDWDSFYVIVGTSAGALIGLQFVVMTLIAERPPQRAAEAGAAFATPTIINFSVTLFLTAMLRAPWYDITPVIILLGLTGLCGIIYFILVGRKMKIQTSYRPVFVDWFFRIFLPMTAYLVLMLSAFTAGLYLRETLFGIAASALLLLFTGINNAWDNVAYHVLVNQNNSKDGQHERKD